MFGFGTSSLDRVWMILFLLALAVSSPGRADQKDKKPTNPPINSTSTPTKPAPGLPNKVPIAHDPRPQTTATFIENRGQFPEQVKFQLKRGGATTWLTNRGVVLDLLRKRAADSEHPGNATQSPQPGRPELLHDNERLVVSEDFISSNPAPEIEAKSPQPGAYNYFTGNDAAKWRTGVRAYAEVTYHNVWGGVDFRLSGNGPDLEQEFIVAPGGDLGQVRIAYNGIDGLKVADDGSLIVRTVFGEIRESRPQVYQEIEGKRVAVAAHFKLTNDKAYTFQVDDYRKEYALVVDPTLLYSTYLGGSAGNSPYTGNFEVAQGIAVDTSGNAYVTGYTASTDFPTTPGAYETSANFYQSAFITKLNATGSALVYSTYLNAAYGNAIAVDASGNAYVAGQQAGGGFPTTPNAYSRSCIGSGFLTVLNQSGSGLVYSSCFGSSVAGASFAVNSMAIDGRGRAFITGGTNAVFSLPTTPTAYQPSYPGGGISGFVTVLDTTASGVSSLVYSTYIGTVIPPSNTSDASAIGIAVDGFGKIYVTGRSSSGFPVTPGAFQTSHSSSLYDAFIAKLDPSQSGSQSLIYATYLGGSSGPGHNGNGGVGIAVDGSGDAYVTGFTESATFPVTPGAFQTTGSGGIFVTKLNAGGSKLLYSTYLGHSSPESYGGIAIDSLGDAYVVGSVNSATFPVTPDAFQSTYIKLGGSTDYSSAFLSKLNPTGSALIYSSYLGGIQDDVATSVAVDQAGDAYVAGHTSSANFPITAGAFQTLMHGTGDAFIAKFPLVAIQTLSISSIGPSSGGNVGTVTPHIQGGGFHSGATVKLVGATTVVGTPVVGFEGRTIDAVFDITGAPAGLYALVVVNPDGTSATLPNAFTVQQGGGPQLKVSIVGPTAVATGHGPVGFTVYVQNAGNTDAIGVILSLYGIPSEAVLKPLFVISPPPAELGGTKYDFSQIPFAPVVGQEQIPNLLLPIVPAGEEISLPFSLAINSLPPVGPLQPQPPTFSGAPPASSSTTNFARSGPAINIAAGVAMFNSFCASTGKSCLQSAVLTEISLIEAIPYLGNIISFYNCVQDFACAKAMLLLADKHHAASVFDFTPIMGTIMLDCCSIVPVEGNIIKAAEAVAGVIVTYLQCLQWLTGSGGTITLQTAIDPNDKEGTTGVASSHWVSGALGLPYGIYFLNEPSATAAAQGVVVTDTLDPSIDLSTLSLNGIVIGGLNVPIPPTFAPAVAQNQAATVADFRPVQNLLVNVNVLLNPASRTLSWQFTSVDPTTGLPPSDPTVGVLPPGVEGSVAYSAKPVSTVTTGTSITNQATIVFDTNPAMNTQTWTNTIDITPPVSHVSALPAASTCPAFRVSWSGSDVGSGLQGFTIYASDTGSPFTPWLPSTTAAAATYTGAAGHTYTFYSIASDLTGNVENGKTSAEASTAVTSAGPCGGPSLSGQTSNVAQSGTTVTATLTLTNTGFTAAQAVNINQVTARTLSGTGTVTLASPSLPAAEGPLAIGASTTVALTLNVPSTVTRFSLTEGGNILDSVGNSYNYSIAQTIIP